MGRKIIVLSDGTGNSAGKLFRTNVWRIYQALDLSGVDQIARYDDGVGTSKFKPLAILGGAVGWGLKRNVIDLYSFLCRNCDSKDEIYGFGFSRGAFTIRVLMKFVLSEGLVLNSRLKMIFIPKRGFSIAAFDKTEERGLGLKSSVDGFAIARFCFGIFRFIRRFQRSPKRPLLRVLNSLACGIRLMPMDCQSTN